MIKHANDTVSNSSNLIYETFWLSVANYKDIWHFGLDLLGLVFLNFENPARSPSGKNRKCLLQNVDQTWVVGGSLFFENYARAHLGANFQIASVFFMIKRANGAFFFYMVLTKLTPYISKLAPDPYRTRFAKKSKVYKVYKWYILLFFANCAW